MTSVTTSYDLLSSLLPSHSYTLVYALPLFFISVLLTFAGSFFTLDRTRSFAPDTAASPQDAQKSNRACSRLTSFRWSTALEGGIGGLASGYAFGVHFSTFLVLLIPNTTSSGPLSPKAFVAVWVLSAIPCTLLGGRWKYAAITLSAITGYAALALSLSVIIHPTLLARIALTAVFTPIGTILCLLPFPRLSRVSLRVACASTGAFGMVLSIALMARVASWGNVWERFWVQNGSDWGTSQERGLSAAYCLLLITGIASDLFLHIRFGENPDEKWDRYLADYTTTLPNDRNRAGTFTPLVSFWDKIFGQHRAFAPVVPDTAFSYDSDLKLPLSTSPELKLSKQRSPPAAELVPELLGGKSRAEFLRKKGSTRVAGMKRTRRAIKFRPLDEEALSSSDEDPFLDSEPPRRSRSLRTDSSATLTNSRTAGNDAGLKPPQRSWTADGAGVPEYSDYESDVGAPAVRRGDRDAPGWTPPFIRRHSTRGPTPSPGAAAASPFSAQQPTPPRAMTSSPIPVAFPVASAPAAWPQAPDGPPAPTSPATAAASSAPAAFPMASVPATPSLIRAVERITAAQEAVYRAQPPSGLPAAPSSPAANRQHREHAWNSFWTEVKAKASS